MQLRKSSLVWRANKFRSGRGVRENKLMIERIIDRGKELAAQPRAFEKSGVLQKTPRSGHQPPHPPSFVTTTPMENNGHVDSELRLGRGGEGATPEITAFSVTPQHCVS